MKMSTITFRFKTFPNRVFVDLFSRGINISKCSVKVMRIFAKNPTYIKRNVASKMHSINQNKNFFFQFLSSKYSEELKYSAILSRECLKNISMKLSPAHQYFSCLFSSTQKIRKVNFGIVINDIGKNLL